jgi:hypothetical protein
MDWAVCGAAYGDRDYGLKGTCYSDKIRDVQQRVAQDHRR